MQVHKTYDHPFTYNNKNLTATICCKYDLESSIPEIDLGSEEFNKKYLEKFKTGEFLNIAICVTASCLDECGEDWLSEVHVKAKLIDDNIDYAINRHNMIENAIDDLKSDINKKIKLFEDNLGLKFTDNN